MPIDIFLSYSHLDDVAPPSPGWIQDFHRRLGEQLAVATGRRYEIWLDRSNHRNNEATAEILQNAAQARCLVTVVSPPHLNSRWCQDELDAFLGRNPLYPVSNRDISLVFKVAKRPVARDLLDPELEQNGEYIFYSSRETVSSELHPEWHGQEYYGKLYQLADHLGSKLEATAPTKVMIIGDENLRIVLDIRRDMRRRVIWPSSKGWPMALGPRRQAFADALCNSQLAVFVTDRDNGVEFWEQVAAASSTPTIRRCMIWLNASPSAKEGVQFDQFRNDPGAKCEVYEAARLSPAMFIQAIRENLEYFDRNPPPTTARVHVVRSAYDKVLERELALARRPDVSVVDAPYSSLSTLAEYASEATAFLIASRDVNEATAWMRRVHARLRPTAMRAAVGFAPTGPIDYGFHSLGENASNVFSHFMGIGS
jgi:hypothetical protein